MFKKIDVKNRFISVFNPKTGFYMRTGVYDENNKDTGIDPFMASFPELIDIGVMGNCIHGKTGLCMKSGVQCYQNGLGIVKPNMTVEQFETIAKQCEKKTFQFALGGRGDVNKHENFREILEICKKYNIVPNYTTSGLDLTDDEVRITKEFCGAVATSWYDDSLNGYTINAINKFVNAGVKTNIHYVLGNNSIDKAIDYLKNERFPKGINAIIFLMHKPVGLGKQSNVLQISNPKVKEFFEIVDSNNFDFKIGFDSCSVPGVLNFTKNIDKISVEGCEGALFSGYITSDMIFTPCSFDNDKLKWGIDLNNYSIQQAWNSELFNNFRSTHKIGCKESCKNCNLLTTYCRPCPITPEISLCGK